MSPESYHLGVGYDAPAARHSPEPNEGVDASPVDSSTLQSPKRAVDEGVSPGLTDQRHDARSATRASPLGSRKRVAVRVVQVAGPVIVAVGALWATFVSMVNTLVSAGSKS